MTALWIVLAVVVYFGFTCGVGAYLGWVSAVSERSIQSGIVDLLRIKGEQHD